MNEPAIDLGIVLAIISSYRENPINEKTICFGEVGLSGEVRAVSMAEQRVTEAKKLGFDECILPQVSLDSMKDSGSAKGNPPDWCEVSERCDGCNIEIKYGGNISLLER